MRRANSVCTNEGTYCFVSNPDYNLNIVIWNKISLKGVNRE